WWLTQIITNKAEKVNFTYERLLPSVSCYGSFNSYQAQVGSNTYAFYNLQNTTGVLHDPVYLRTITYGNLSAQFSYQPSNIFFYSRQPALNPNGGWDSAPSPISTMASLYANWLPSQEYNVVPPTDYELDTIIVNYAGSATKQYTFTYYDASVANRIFLKSFTTGPVTRALVYQFAYNGMTFYNYCDSAIYDGLLTPKIDHWGFYNGKFPY